MRTHLSSLAAGSDVAVQSGEQRGRQAALHALRAACRRGAHDAAADAVQIFMPACPLLKCLRMMQVTGTLCCLCSYALFASMQALLSAL